DALQRAVPDHRGRRGEARFAAMSTEPRDTSRREFVAAGAAALITAGLSADVSTLTLAKVEASAKAELTAQQAIDRIRGKVGVAWRDTTVDTFKAGDPNTVVTGIATTVMATLPVLRKAADAG